MPLGFPKRRFFLPFTVEAGPALELAASVRAALGRSCTTLRRAPAGALSLRPRLQVPDLPQLEPFHLALVFAMDHGATTRSATMFGSGHHVDPQNHQPCFGPRGLRS
jgi:hypothetical protein